MSSANEDVKVNIQGQSQAETKATSWSSIKRNEDTDVRKDIKPDQIRRVRYANNRTREIPLYTSSVFCGIPSFFQDLFAH